MLAIHIASLNIPSKRCVKYLTGPSPSCPAKAFSHDTDCGKVAVQENHAAVMYFQVNITAPGGARSAELHQASSQDPLNTNGNTTAVLWGPNDPHQDKVR